jgi:hypothetical protein
MSFIGPNTTADRGAEEMYNPRRWRRPYTPASAFAESLYEAYHVWLNAARSTFEISLDDEYGEMYEEGAVYDLWVAWYDRSRQKGAYVENFERGTDCYNTVIMPAVHELRSVLNAIEASDISFYSPYARKSIIRKMDRFEENVETLFDLQTRREAFAMGMMDRVGEKSLVSTLGELGLIDKILHHSII